MYELAVDADTEELRVTRLEFLVELAERGDLGWTHEGEVLRPEEHDLPLAGKAVVVEGLESPIEVARDGALELETGKRLADTGHVIALLSVRVRPGR